MFIIWWKVIIGLVLVIATKVECNYSELERTEWQRSSFFYGILSLAASDESENNSCVNEIKAISDGLDRQELWALKTYDASGRAQSNFIYGQIFWLGSEYACENLNHEINIAVSAHVFHELKTTTAPFEMKYAIAYANYTTLNQFSPVSFLSIPIHIGLCLPKSCTNDQILKYSQNYFSSDIFSFKRTYDLFMDVVEVKKTSFEEFITREDTISIISILGIIVLIVTGFNIAPMRNLKSDNFFKRVAKCFNIKENYTNLMSNTMHPEAIVPIDAIKTIVCFLIMLAHMCYFSVFISGNAGVMLGAFYDIRFLILFLCTLYVDAFFVTSAFLQCYNFLNNEKQKKEILENNIFRKIGLYLKLAFHRYLRLTPAFVFTIAVAHLVAVYIKHTLPVNVSTDLDLYCDINSFWKSLLYIHGYFGVQDMCATWTWYLSSEMQYFLIILFGLLIYVKRARLGKVFFVSLCLVSLIYTYIKSAEENFLFNHDRFVATVNSLYVNPLVRMNPVFPGVLGAYLLYKMKKSPIKLTKKIIYPWAAISLALLISCLVTFRYVQYFPAFISHGANSLGRFGTSLVFVATILITHLGHGGSFGKFMRHKYFVHFSKLTYLMYLLYPILVALFVASVEEPYTMTVATTYIDGFGITLVCYFASILATLFFEIPYYKLSSEFIMKNRKISVPPAPAEPTPAS